MADRLDARITLPAEAIFAENAATLRAIARVPRIIEVPRLAPLDAAAIDRFVARHDLSGLFAP